MKEVRSYNLVVMCDPNASSECKSQVVSRDIVKGWLSNPRKYLSGSDESIQPGQATSDATWLLIFDNADDPMILADYWPQGSGSILVTSRDPLAKSMFTRRPSGLDLGPLTQQDSLSLFNHLTTGFDEPEDDTARGISDALGGVPLAITLRYHPSTGPHFVRVLRVVHGS